ncbi:MAG: ATP-binding protein [Rubrivivax sp.]|nr:ATP-binding protein [Rubrivivax sp.]
METCLPRIDFNAVTGWITRAAIVHGDNLPAELARRLDIGPGQLSALLEQLTQQGWLVAHSQGQQTVYRPGALRQVALTYALAGLEEDLPWRRDFAPSFELSRTQAQTLGQAVSELLNNAIDHSGGTQVSLSLRQTPHSLQLLVADDGIGLFQHLSETVAISDPALALLELSKGRLTSQPLHHCGHGLLLSARLADVCVVQANGQSWMTRQGDGGAWQSQLFKTTRNGTSVFLSIARDATRTPESVLSAWRADDTDFSRTCVPLRLLVQDQASTMLHSRADARRVTHRLTTFALAELDFEGIEALGPAFTDELLRVWARSHPQVQLKYLHAAPQVLQALHRVT